MIGKLSGILDSIIGGQVILDVQGVGYLVSVSPQTLSKIGGTGEAVSLYIDTHVREDAISLYGFADTVEQEWFGLLISVQGVGAKAAFSILGVCPPEKLAFAIAAQDKAALTQADGVGPKLATRILTELKDKAAKLQTSSDFAISSPSAGGGSTGAAGGTAQTSSTSGSQKNDQDALSALVNLGYGRSDAFAAIQAVHQKAENDNTSLEELIRLALKELAS